MFLIRLAEDGTTVTFVEQVTPVASLPILIPLDSSYMLSPVAPRPGQIFDPVMRTFVEPPRKRWITKLAFDNRFTIAEAVALKALQTMPARGAEESDADYIARSQIPAQLQVLQNRLNMASYVDLDRTDTREGVLWLEAMGLLAAGRALEILDGPIAEHEYHWDA